MSASLSRNAEFARSAEAAEAADSFVRMLSDAAFADVKAQAEKRLASVPALAADAAGYAARTGRQPAALATAISAAMAQKAGQPHRLLLVTCADSAQSKDRFIAALATFSRAGVLQTFTLAAEASAVAAAADPAETLVAELASLTEIAAAKYGLFFGGAGFADASQLDTNPDELVEIAYSRGILGAVARFDVLEFAHATGEFVGGTPIPDKFAQALVALTIAAEFAIRAQDEPAWAPNAHWDPFIEQLAPLATRFVQAGEYLLGNLLPTPDRMPIGLRLGIQRVYDAPNEALYQDKTQLRGYEGPETLTARLHDQLFALVLAGISSLPVGFVYGAGVRYSDRIEPADLSAVFRGAVARDRYARDEVIAGLAAGYTAARGLADDLVNRMAERTLELVARTALLKQVYSLQLLPNRGRSLRQQPAAAVFETAADGVAVLAQLCAGLVALHENGIRHGDVHAGNICYGAPAPARVLVVLTPATVVSTHYKPTALIDVDRASTAHWTDQSLQQHATRAVLRLAACKAESLLKLPLEVLTTNAEALWGPKASFVLAALDDHIALFSTLAEYSRGTPAARVCADAYATAQAYFVKLLEPVEARRLPAARPDVDYGVVRALLDQVFAGHTGELLPPAAYAAVCVPPQLAVADSPQKMSHLVDTEAAPGADIVRDIIAAGDAKLGGMSASARAAREAAARLADDDAGFSAADFGEFTRAFDAEDAARGSDSPDKVLETLANALENARAASARAAW